MKATITDVPQPKPPRVVTLEMTETEARILYAVALTNESVPPVVAPVVARFLPSLSVRAIEKLLSDLSSEFYRINLGLSP